MFFSMDSSVLYLNQLFLVRRKVYHKFPKAAPWNARYSDLPWVTERWWRGRHLTGAAWESGCMSNRSMKWQGPHKQCGGTTSCSQFRMRTVYIIFCWKMTRSRISARPDVDYAAEWLTQYSNKNVEGDMQTDHSHCYRWAGQHFKVGVRWCLKCVTS